jgi:arylsulfatase
MLPYFCGETNESPRKGFYYVSDDGDLLAVRYKDWKVVFMEQRAKTLACWAEPFVSLRVPKIFNLRRDPFERADENSNTYWDFVLNHAFVLVPVQSLVAEQIKSFNDFPPRQKPSSFNLDRVLEQLQEGAANSR